MSQREQRAARNEDLFRRLNERLHALSGIGRDSVPVATAEAQLERFVCECAQTSCSRVLELTSEEYRSVRVGGRRFLVYPDESHTSPELEEVVERCDRFWIVQKFGEAGEEAAELVDRHSDPL
jgi:hypothetical protein